MTKQAVKFVLPVTLDPADPSVPIALEIQLQNFPPANPPETSISILDNRGQLRKFEEIQTEYATRALKLSGNATKAAKLSGLTRQTLSKWAQT